MDDLFWRQAYGDDYQGWLASIGVDDARRFAEANYGPWDRLNDDAPFMPDVGEKPLGAKFYPADMTKDEFEAAKLEGKTGLYSFIRRNKSGEYTARNLPRRRACYGGQRTLPSIRALRIISACGGMR
jgi:hypothetical protein